MRKTTSKIAALVTCFALLSIYVPLAYAAPNTNRYFRTINIPGEIISSVFFYLSPVNTIGLRAVIEKGQGNTRDNIRATGDIPIRRKGEED